MIRQLFIAFLVFSAFPLLTQAQSSKEGIGAMDWFVGKWSISTEEQDSDGSFFKESGFNQCAYVSRGRMIRCELSLITEEADGRYKDSWASRSIISYISYDNQKNEYLIRHVFPNRTNSHNFLAKSPSVFEGKWVNPNHSIGGDLDVTLTFELIDKNNYQHTEFLQSQTNSFQEDFRLIGRRIE